jgi:hypothetical protein
MLTLLSDVAQGTDRAPGEAYALRRWSPRALLRVVPRPGPRGSWGRGRVVGSRFAESEGNISGHSATDNVHWVNTCSKAMERC